MTPEQAADLAARTLAAIDAHYPYLRRTANLYGVTEDDSSLWDDKADAARAEYLEDEK